ncbi:MAG: hypothetical protein ACRDP6_23935 [Actinoallomurus sp.]
MADSNGSIVYDIDKMRIRYRELDSALAGKLLKFSDGSNSVTAISNGHGAIVGLEVHEIAAEHPSLLGGRLTSTVNRATHAGRELSKKAEEKYLPELPSLDDVLSEMGTLLFPLDYHSIEYEGSRENKNMIASNVETIQQIIDTVERFKRQAIIERIDGDIGRVSMVIDGSRLKIEISLEVISRSGALYSASGRVRLAGQVVSAINRAHIRVAKLRLAAVEDIKKRKESLR